MKYTTRLLGAAIALVLLAVHARAGSSLPWPDDNKEWTKSPIAWGDLPKEVTKTVVEVRDRCKEADGDDVEPPQRWQGISFVDLKGDGSRDIVVDHQFLCHGPRAGYNCSNRGCNVEIYKEVSRGKWRKVFSEHLYGYDKYYVYDWDNHKLQMMIVSIFLGDLRCQPDPKKEYSSGRSFNLIVMYKGGKWIWQKIK